MPALIPEDHAKIEPRHIYVAAPDRHLLVEPGEIRVVRGPRENRHRPGIDPLFRSAAWAYGPRVVAAVLSGTLDDGAAGLWAVKSCGGVTVVQDPADAVYPDMPTNAMMSVQVDHCLPVSDIAALIAKLAREPVDGVRNSTIVDRLRAETEYVTMDRDIRDISQFGSPSAFTCPTCRGALWELRDGELVRYRCHIGHAFSADSLLVEQTDAVENALETGLRAVEEKAATLRRLADRFGGKFEQLEAQYLDEAQRLDDQAVVIRHMLASKGP